MQTRPRHHAALETGTSWGVDTRHRVFAALGSTESTLHELDFEDLTLNAAAMRLVRRAGTAVLRQFCAVDDGEVSLARALALFLDHVFWEEKSGGLILCADFPDQSFCLPIPRDMWGLKDRLARVQ